MYSIDWRSFIKVYGVSKHICIYCCTRIVLFEFWDIRFWCALSCFMSKLWINTQHILISGIGGYFQKRLLKSRLTRTQSLYLYCDWEYWLFNNYTKKISFLWTSAAFVPFLLFESFQNLHSLQAFRLGFFYIFLKFCRFLLMIWDFN